MKITNLIPTNKLALVSAAFCAAMLAFTHKASAQTFGDARDLGQVLLGIPSGDPDRLSYVNHLIDMAPGTSDTSNGQTFHRSLANPGPGFPNYPDAVLTGLVNGTSTTKDLGPTAGVYQYLFAKYDGPNTGAEVWYVGDLSGVITIPALGLSGEDFGLSGWTLFRGPSLLPSFFC